MTCLPSYSKNASCSEKPAQASKDFQDEEPWAVRAHDLLIHLNQHAATMLVFQRVPYSIKKRDIILIYPLQDVDTFCLLSPATGPSLVTKIKVQEPAEKMRNSNDIAAIFITDLRAKVNAITLPKPTSTFVRTTSSSSCPSTISH